MGGFSLGVKPAIYKRTKGAAPTLIQNTESMIVNENGTGERSTQNMTGHSSLTDAQEDSTQMDN